MRSVTFITEGGSSVGMGHISRCVNIAHASRALGLGVMFLTNDDPTVAGRLIGEDLERADFAFEDPGAYEASGDASEVVVIDTKRDVSELASAVKKTGRKVVVIDNTTGRDDVDLVVRPTAFAPEESGGPGMVTGAEYIIIGPGFIEAKHTTQRPPHSSPLKVLVTMGGADPFNLTEQVVTALRGVEDVDVTVVLGPAFEPTETLVEFMASGGSGFKFLHGVTDMASVMVTHHVAFTAVGTTINELSYLGVPSVVLSNYRQDASDLAAIERLGVGVPLGYYEDVADESIRGVVELFKRDRSAWELHCLKAAALTDGLGAVRIAGLVNSLAAEGGAEPVKERHESQGLRELKHA